MNDALQKRLSALNADAIIRSLSGIKRGFEKECLRVSEKGMLAQTPHPQKLGSSLMHPMITTDYSEALLEFITPPMTDITGLFQVLDELHRYTYSILDHEFLWSASMPCQLPPEDAIPIAEYGTSNLGRLKHIYRQGLGHRYGRSMQTIAGLHYNFSFSIDFWKHYAPLIKPDVVEQSSSSFSNFISDQYLGLIRNAMRLGWILPLLLGASPAICKTFLKGSKTILQEMDSDTLFLPYATSLRLSDLGYHNRVKPTFEVSHNSFSEFIKTMHDAVHTPHPEFTRLGVKKHSEYQQLSDSILQVEDEHYALLRPKRVSAPGERMLDILSRKGVEYIEIRALDINPSLPLGVGPTTIYILDAFLILCLLMDSPPIIPSEEERIRYNFTQVVTMGRKPNRMLLSDTTERSLVGWATEILSSLITIGGILDRAYNRNVFTPAIQEAHNSVLKLSSLPSACVLTEMREHKESYLEFVNRWSHIHQQYFKKLPLSEERLSFYKELSQESLKKQQEIEQNDILTFDEFLKNFLA